MARTGFLEGARWPAPSTLLRPNELIFNYVVSNWLLGEEPPAFDILAWNADSTRMPARMHAFYLRSLYVKNLLARGELELAGRLLRWPKSRATPTWSAPSTTTSCRGPRPTRQPACSGGDVRYVLSSGGHIAGIVNPPRPKSWYEVAEENAAKAGRLAIVRDERHGGSWWEDWTGWASGRAGSLVSPPPMGSAGHPPLGDAPGEYVRS